MKQFNHDDPSSPHGGAVAHAVHEMRWWWSDVEQTWREQSAVLSGGGQTDKYNANSQSSRMDPSACISKGKIEIWLRNVVFILYFVYYEIMKYFVTSMLDLLKLGFSETLIDALINDWPTYLWHVQVGRSHCPPSKCGSSILATSHRQKSLSDSNYVTAIKKRHVLCD